MNERRTWLSAAMLRSSSISSCSPSGRRSPSLSGCASRIAEGTVAAASASSDAWPSAASISATSASVGEMWRRANVSEGARTSGCTGATYQAARRLETSPPPLPGAEQAQVPLREVGELHLGPALAAGDRRHLQGRQLRRVRDRVDERH